MSQKAAFQLNKYLFNKIQINLDNRHESELIVDFDPSGVFHSNSSSYDLKFTFTAFFKEKGIENPFVLIECIGFFQFENVHTIDKIPSFFYRNAIAILFPYLRAFVSMVTLQANVSPVVLPTFNLGELEGPLQENTQIQ
jgi:preprotein translocase subunit SecB